VAQTTVGQDALVQALRGLEMVGEQTKVIAPGSPSDMQEITDAREDLKLPECA